MLKDLEDIDFGNISVSMVELQTLRNLKTAIQDLIDWEETPCPFCDSDSEDDRSECTCFQDREIWERIREYLGELRRLRSDE